MYRALFVGDIFLCILLCIVKGFSVNGNRKGSVFAWFRYRINIKILFTLLLALQIPLVFFIGFCGTNPDKQILHLTPELSDLCHIGQLWGNLRFGERLLQGMGCIFTVISGSGAEFLVHFTDFEWVGIALCVIAPLLTMSALILSILDFFPLCFLPRREYLIFSHMDERSLLLAKNMMKKTREDEEADNESSRQLRRDRKVIFLHTDKGKLSAEEREKINQVRGRIYPYSEVDLLRIHKGLRKRTLRFFFLSKDSDESFSRLKELIDGVQQFNLFRTPKRRSKELEALETQGIYQQELYFLSESDSSSLLVDHLRSKMSDWKKEETNTPKSPNAEQTESTPSTEKQPLCTYREVRKKVFAHTELHLLDRYRTVTYELLRKHPLYDHANNKEINVLIVGFGKVGQSFYKTANAFSYIKEHTVSFTIMDKEMDDRWQEFLTQVPEIDKIISPKYFSLNAESKKLEATIRELSDTHPFTYIMLSVGDDDRNIRIARTLVRYYRKKYWEDQNTVIPAIFVNLENKIKSEYIEDIFTVKDHNDHKDPLKKLSPKVIGGDHDTFSENMLLNRKVWEMAVKLHNGMNETITYETDGRKVTPFITEYERRSSIAAVSYVKYHCHSLSPNASDEHQRWARYSRSEGMQGIEPEIASNIIKGLQTHRDVVAGLSPCLVEEKELAQLHEDLSKTYIEEGLNPPESFARKDEYVVKNAQQLANFYDHPQNKLCLTHINSIT